MLNNKASQYRISKITMLAAPQLVCQVGVNVPDTSSIVSEIIAQPGDADVFVFYTDMNDDVTYLGMSVPRAAVSLEYYKP